MSGNRVLNLQNNGTSFSNTTLNATGTSQLYASGSLSVTGSTFTFNGFSEFANAGGTLNINSSHLYFYSSANFSATAGPINLNNNTQMVAGDGTTGSAAYILINGPIFNFVDAGSAFYVANTNNYYANWNSYNSLSNSKSYTTTNNNKNCGGSGQNACSAQKFFGCASFGNVGAATCTTLAVSITDFKAAKSGTIVNLSWSLSEASVNSYFRVERSSDGNYFTPITTIEVGSDDQYAFTDYASAAGENNYRISLINADGKISYSKIISIQMGNSEEINVFPNPASGGRIFIQTSNTETATLSVFRMDGQLLFMRSLNGQLKYSVSLPATQNAQLLVVRIVTKEKSASFNLLNLP
jgi:hypothetical protein